jgi:transcriptional regulator with XRE-family HTH domain
MSPDSTRDQQLHALGAFIRAQRQLANLSLRQLADLTHVSNPYLSQLERGLHEPSIRVLRALAASLGIQPNQLINYAAGLPVDGADDRSDIRTEDAIRSDPRLTTAQKKALLGVVKSYVDGTDAT